MTTTGGTVRHVDHRGWGSKTLTNDVSKCEHLPRRVFTDPPMSVITRPKSSVVESSRFSREGLSPRSL